MRSLKECIYKNVTESLLYEGASDKLYISKFKDNDVYVVIVNVEDDIQYGVGYKSFLKLSFYVNYDRLNEDGSVTNFKLPGGFVLQRVNFGYEKSYITIEGWWAGSNTDSHIKGDKKKIFTPAESKLIIKEIIDRIEDYLDSDFFINNDSKPGIIRNLMTSMKFSKTAKFRKGIETLEDDVDDGTYKTYDKFKKALCTAKEDMSRYYGGWGNSYRDIERDIENGR